MLTIAYMLIASLDPTISAHLLREVALHHLSRQLPAFVDRVGWPAVTTNQAIQAQPPTGYYSRVLLKRLRGEFDAKITISMYHSEKGDDPYAIITLFLSYSHSGWAVSKHDVSRFLADPTERDRAMKLILLMDGCTP